MSSDTFLHPPEKTARTVCHDGFFLGSGSGMEGSQVLVESRRVFVFVSIFVSVFILFLSPSPSLSRRSQCPSRGRGQNLPRCPNRTRDRCRGLRRSWRLRL